MIKFFRIILRVLGFILGILLLYAAVIGCSFLELIPMFYFFPFLVIAFLFIKYAITSK